MPELYIWKHRHIFKDFPPPSPLTPSHSLRNGHGSASANLTKNLTQIQENGFQSLETIEHFIG